MLMHTTLNNVALGHMTDLCFKQCLSCDVIPPPQVRVQAVHLDHSPHQYAVAMDSATLLEATPPFQNVKS